MKSLSRSASLGVIIAGSNARSIRQRMAFRAICLLMVIGSIGLVWHDRHHISGLWSGSPVYIPDAEYVFSKSEKGVVEHTFKIVNARMIPLHFTAEPSCGCLRVVPRKGDIPPMGCTFVSVSITASGTETHQSVTLETDDSSCKHLFAFMNTY